MSITPEKLLVNVLKKILQKVIQVFYPRNLIVREHHTCKFSESISQKKTMGLRSLSGRTPTTLIKELKLVYINLNSCNTVCLQIFIFISSILYDLYRCIQRNDYRTKKIYVWRCPVWTVSPSRVVHISFGERKISWSTGFRIYKRLQNIAETSFSGLYNWNRRIALDRLGAS
jgi:hypothetical protein